MLPNWLSLIDLVFVGIGLLFAWGGYQKGFAEQVSHILTFVIMGVVLFFGYPALFNYFGQVFRNIHETYIMWLLFAGLLVLTFVVLTLMSKLLARLLKTQISDRSDAIGGFFLGLTRGLLAALFAMIILVILGPPKIFESFRVKSYVGRTVCYELAPRVQPHLTKAVLGERVQGMKSKLLEQEEGGALE